jgi:hypothetical protein
MQDWVVDVDAGTQSLYTFDSGEKRSQVYLRSQAILDGLKSATRLTTVIGQACMSRMMWCQIATSNHGLYPWTDGFTSKFRGLFGIGRVLDS